jgi:hypothetical protein
MLFAGHAILRASGAPTYAQYVHEGFVEVSIAAFLAVACVVVGHALLRPRTGAAVTSGGWRLAAVELTLLGFVGLALLSSAHRLNLYEEAYGYTELRLGVRFFQVGVAGLLALTGARCVARGLWGWGSALTWAALAMSVVVGSFDADGWVACRSIERAQAGGPLDVAYLSGLSEDALGALSVSGKLVLRPGVIGDLELAWSAIARAHRSRGWRSWRGLGAPHLRPSVRTVPA